MSSLKNLVFPFARLGREIIRQYLYAQKLSKESLNNIRKQTSSEWDNYPTIKYEIFYGTLVPINLHTKMASLHNVAYSQELRRTSTAQAIITGVYDDLIDEWDSSPERIKTILFSDKFESNNVLELLCRQYFDIIKYGVNQKLFYEVVPALIMAQEKSKEQFNPNICEDDVIKITKEKGGYAMLFYRSSISHPCSTDEYNFYYTLGGLLQMTNDINDAYKDYLSGTKTLMHLGWPITKIEKVFKDQINQVNLKWESWQGHRSRKNFSFFTRINVITSRSLVTLNEYKYQFDYTEANTSFDINKIPKNKLIKGIGIPWKLFSWYSYWSNLQNKGV